MSNKRLGRLTLATALAVAAALIGLDRTVTAGDNTPMKRVMLPKYTNADFYQDGQFQVEKAKQAYFNMMAAHGYPVPESLRTNMWATDFSLGDFVHAGMAGIFWVNSQESGISPTKYTSCPDR